MDFLELRQDSRVTTGNSGCLLCWPREVLVITVKVYLKHMVLVIHEESNAYLHGSNQILIKLALIKNVIWNSLK